MNNTFMGFGDVAVQSTAVAKPSAWDKIGNVLTNVVKPAADIYTQVKTGQQQPTGTVSNPSMYPQPFPTTQTPPPPAATENNTKKYLIIGGVGLLAVTGIFLATQKKGKK
jgi:hypothetical protein